MRPSIHKYFSLESKSIWPFLLIPMILGPSVFVVPDLFHPNQISAENKPLMNYPYSVQSQGLPRLIVFDLPTKETIGENTDPIVKELIRHLVAKADSYLLQDAPSVMEKKRLPPSGNKHDFLSLAPFHWPDSTKPNGIPYVYRDGKFNPEIYSAPDGIFMRRMIDRVKILSVAYYYTGDTIYANKTAELLRVWFLNNETYMNPNLQHAEVITGKNNGTRSGIIVGNYLPLVLDAITLIEDSSVWTLDDQKQIESWFDKYLEWLLSSKFGKKEGKAPNNHGTWYDVQASSIALFLNKTEITRSILEKSINNLISEKIQPNGSQPFELQRNTSLDYHIFNLMGFFYLARIGDNIGIDLWKYETPEGSGLQKALNLILPFTVGTETWPHKQIRPIDKEALHDLICQAAVHYHDDFYRKAYKSLGHLNTTMQIDSLIYGCNKLVLDF